MKPLIVAFSGAARVGKDTSADAPCFLKGWRRDILRGGVESRRFRCDNTGEEKGPALYRVSPSRKLV